MMCHLETEKQEFRFVCTLDAGHLDRGIDHAFWLAAPPNTLLELPRCWSAELLQEDDI